MNSNVIVTVTPTIPPHVSNVFFFLLKVKNPPEGGAAVLLERDVNVIILKYLSNYHYTCLHYMSSSHSNTKKTPLL